VVGAAVVHTLANGVLVNLAVDMVALRRTALPQLLVLLIAVAVAVAVDGMRMDLLKLVVVVPEE
jgi:hypothetical protein